MAVGKDKKRFSVTVTLSMYDRLEEIGRQRGMSVSALAGEALIEKYGGEQTAVSNATTSKRTN